MILAHNKLYDSMIKNNINPNMININNIKFFTDIQTNYILALNFESYKLKSMIYLTGSGIFEKIDPKSYYLIVRALKKAQDENMCNMICNILLSESEMEKALKEINTISYSSKIIQFNNNEKIKTLTK